MTDEHYDKLMKALQQSGRRMKRDKKYALETYVRLGIMTSKGKLTPRWKKIQRLCGITFHKVPTLRDRD